MTPIPLPENPTHQDILQAAYKGVLRQGRLSQRIPGKTPVARPYTGCFYRHPDNDDVGCNIGVLIDDEMAHAWDTLDDTNIEDVFLTRHEHGMFPTWLNKQNLGFLERLQVVHDDCKNLPEYREKMAAFAMNEGLTLEELMTN